MCDFSSASPLFRSVVNSRKRPISALLGAAFALSSNFASGAGFVIKEDIENGFGTGQQYIGSGVFGSFLGATLDGGNDAFDAYGRWQDPGTPGSSLAFTRRVDALTASNTYRFLDIFTNPTGSPITTALTFFGGLGSDGDEMIDSSISGLTVSHESRPDGWTGDPVIAHVYGNNAFAAANMSAAIDAGIYTCTVNLSLNPGESIGILQFAYLSREDTSVINYGTSGTNTFAPYVADAIAAGSSLLNNPDLTGLSEAELGSISNFGTVPEPSSALLLTLALTAAGLHRRRS